MSTTLVRLCVAWLVASSAALAQAPVAAPQPPMSLEELEELAGRFNPTLAQARAAYDQARGGYVQAGMYPNPQGGYLRTESERGGQSRSTGLFVGQEFVTGGKLGKNQAVEAREMDRLAWQYQAQARRVQNDVRIRFFEALGAEEASQLSGRLLEIAEQGLATAETLHRVRQAPKTDVLQARIQMKAVRLSQVEAAARRRTAWTQLTNVVGLPDLAPAPLAGSLVGELPRRDFDACFAELLAGSPQLRAAEARIAHARAELAREQAQVAPNVNVQVVAERDHIAQNSSVSMFFSAPVPVLNHNQGNILHAEADVREAVAEVARTHLALRDALAEAFQRYEQARAQVKTLRDDILPDAGESLEAAVQGQRAGEVGFLQVLAARQTYFESHLAYVHAWTELQKAVVEIDGLLLTGALNPAELGTALQGGGIRSSGLLNQLQERNSQPILPAAVQAGAGP